MTQNNAGQSSLKKIRGDVLTAKDWNAAMDRFQVATNGAPAGFPNLSNTVSATNNTGANVEFGECLTLGAGAVTDETLELYRGLATLDNPTWPSSISRVVVAAEPIPDGEVGAVVVSGMCWAKVASGAAYSPANCWVMLDPADTSQFKATTGGMGRLFGVAGDFALVDLGARSNLWRYELTQDSQAPAVTTAKLITLSGGQFAASVDLSDPESYMADQLTGDTGHCICVGNGFEAIQAPCETTP